MALKAIVEQSNGEELERLLAALKIVKAFQILPGLIDQNTAKLVRDRLDGDDEVAILKEVRDIRQTNRVLATLQMEIDDILEGIE